MAMYAPPYASKVCGSNLQNLLQSFTPSVPAHSLHKQSNVGSLNSLWQPLGSDPVQYFNLSDLWRCFDESSVYGVGVPVVFENGESIMQYYTPYLSFLNIYTNKSIVPVRNSKLDADKVEPESDTWSDESETNRLSRSLSNSSSKWDANSEESTEQDSTAPMKDSLGYVYLQYCEYASPYWRIPLVEKIAELAKHYPGLNTLKSVDLSPASWMAVAWYPIYHIPNLKHVKELPTRFLTFHTLSSSFLDVAIEDVDVNWKSCLTGAVGKQKHKKDRSRNKISLVPFGLATQKMVGGVWTKPGTSDPKKMIGLQCAADSWLKQLNIYHHDFNFFQHRSTCNRG